MEGNPIGDLTGCRGRLAGQANRPAWLAPPVEPEFTLKGNPIGATLQAAHGGGKPCRQPNKPHKAEGNPVGDPTSRPRWEATMQATLQVGLPGGLPSKATL